MIKISCFKRIPTCENSGGKKENEQMMKKILFKIIKIFLVRLNFKSVFFFKNFKFGCKIFIVCMRTK